jgi:PIN domain nuclease of toxin-antitoxin system
LSSVSSHLIETLDSILSCLHHIFNEGIVGYLHFLWLITDDSKLIPLAKEIFLDSWNELLLCAATGFELAINYSLRKLHLTESPKEFISNRIQANTLTELPIALNHTYALQNLPLRH